MARTPTPSRRQILDMSIWLVGSAALTDLGCMACPAPRIVPSAPPPKDVPPPGLTDEDLAILRSPDGPLEVVQQTSGESNVLRRHARSLTQTDAESLPLLERRMRETLAGTGGGVGLAGPQVGVGARAILVMRDARGDNPQVMFYLNPRIVQRSDELTSDYEGCLSIRDVCGLVKRNRHIVLEHGLDGSVQREEASDFDARIFQHEIDHLDGVLYVDRVEGELQPRDRLKELREKLREQQPTLACTPVIRGRRRDEILL